MKPITRTLLWIVRQVAGWSLILLGLAGIVLPGLPGWIFIFLGVLLLAEDIPLFKRLLQKIECRWPRTRGTIRKARQWLGQQPQPEPDCPSDKIR